MTKRIDSDALGVVEAQLGIKGVGGGSQSTELHDGELAQILDVHNAVRRGRADVGTAGWFYALMKHAHVAAGNINTTLNPYAPGALNNNSFPERVPADMDLWIEALSVQLNAGTASQLDGAFCFLNLGSRLQAMGVLGAATPLGASTQLLLGIWNSSATLTQTFLRNGTDSRGDRPMGIRIPRSDTTIGFQTGKTGAGAFDLTLTIVFGLFPVGMGSDVARW